jgi:hypothetical protein
LIETTPIRCIIDDTGDCETAVLRPQKRRGADLTVLFMDLTFQASLGKLAPTGTAKGLGVFASRDIAAGEVVEVAPVLQLRTRFEDMEADLQRRVFNWERLASLPGISAVALGYGGMYNHANPANLRYRSAGEGQAIVFTAARNIARGEELTINYNRTGGEPVSDEDEWFMESGVVPLTEPNATPRSLE